MKRILLIALIGLASIVASKAAIVTGSDMAATNTDSIVTTPLVTTKMTFWTTNTTTPSIVRLYDGYRLQTNSAYTNYTVAATAVATTYVTTTGVTNSFTNTVLKTTSNPVAAATVITEPTLTIVVPTGGELLTLDDSLVFGKRLSISNSAAGLNYAIQYRSP